MVSEKKQNPYLKAVGKRTGKQLLSAGIFIIVLLGGWFFPSLGYFIPACMVLGLGIGFYRGRKWCDWLCPRGSFYDAWLKGLSPKKKIPALFRNIPFRLVVMALLMTFMTVNLALRWPDVNRIGLVFVTLLTVTTGAGIVLALFIHPRAWCSICPIGTMVNLTGRKKNPLRIESQLCTDCSLCAKVCPVQVAPHHYKGEGCELIRDRDCLACDLCTAVCPKNALKR
jgi:ferredoxin-type protein NapH